ncbi:hypothetical protein FBU30_002680 [Linnemannia zychae]|nr:hypothetical protein FBU30_002680 [Linnemannia zychae]
MISSFLHFLSFFLILTPTTTTAQSDYTPTPYFYLQSVFVDSEALYIHGGLDSFSSDPSPQTFLLNLSTSWDVSDPPFLKLPDKDGGPGKWGTASTLQNDKHTWYMFDNQTTISQFDIGPNNRRWVRTIETEDGISRTRQLVPNSTISAIAAVTDPETDQVYVIDGWNNTNTLRYLPAVEKSERAGPLAPVSLGYAAVWSKVRGSLLIHSGAVRTKSGWYYPRSLYQLFLTPSTDYGVTDGIPLYAALNDTGDVPSPRRGHCMVESKNGTKIVVFGGFNDQGKELGDIYVLDVATLRWVAGTNGGPDVARGYAACGMSNNLFVVWGGARINTQRGNEPNPVTKNITLVYNLTSHAWQTTFAYPNTDDGWEIKYPYLPTTSTDGPIPNPSATGSSTPTSLPDIPIGTIVGGSVVGGLTLIAAAGAGIFIYLRKTRVGRVQPFIMKSRWSNVSGHGFWWNRRRNRDGYGNKDKDPENNPLHLESINGSSTESVHVLQEVPDSSPLVQNQHQHQLTRSEETGGVNGGANLIMNERPHGAVPKPSRPPASAYTPNPLYNPSYVFIERKALYIHGGVSSISSSPSTQSFYIDLSQAWAAAQPAYVRLQDGYPALGSTSALINNDMQWMSVCNSTVFSVNTGGGAWTAWTELANSEFISSNANMPAVVDPATNQLYILNGWSENRTVTGSLQIDPARKQVLSQPVVAPLAGSFTATWSTLIKAAIVFGGYSVNSDGVGIAQRTTYIYQPTGASPTLSTAYDSGMIPSARYGHCMVEAYNGTKMVLFGGHDQSAQAMGDIYILDVNSLKWTRGTDGGASAARAYPACAVTNDLFIAWGGEIPDPSIRTATATTTNITIIYNLKSHQWQSWYSPEPYNGSLPAPTNTPISPPTPTASRGQKIDSTLLAVLSVAGGIILGLILSAIACGICWCRRRQSRAIGVNPIMSRDPNSAQGSMGGDKTSIHSEELGEVGKDGDSGLGVPPRPFFHIENSHQHLSTASSSEATLLPQSLVQSVIQPVLDPQHSPTPPPLPTPTPLPLRPPPNIIAPTTSYYAPYALRPRFSIASTASVAVAKSPREPTTPLTPLEIVETPTSLFDPSFLPDRATSSGSGGTASVANAVAGTSVTNDTSDSASTFSNTRQSTSEMNVPDGTDGTIVRQLSLNEAMAAMAAAERKEREMAPNPLTSTEIELREYLNYLQFIQEHNRQQQQSYPYSYDTSASQY